MAMVYHRLYPLQFALVALAGLLAALPRASVAAPPSTQPHVDYIIVVTGGELLTGVYADTHTLFLTRTLTPLGLHCLGSISVDDRPDDLKEALRFAKNKSKLILVTGGLGPTQNDITRDTLADFTGIQLQEQPALIEDMQRRYKLSAEQLRPNLRRQTHTPVSGGWLKNPNGSAVGLIFESPDSTIVALPGPPRELQPMVRDELLPYLKRRFGTRVPGCSLTLRFVGLGQSQISQTLKDRVPMSEDVTLYSQFEGSRVDYIFSFLDDTAENRARLEELKQKIREYLADSIYADDQTSLEECVAKKFALRGLSIAVCEVGSGGSLASGLSAADSAHRVLAGALVAPTEEKLRRLLEIPDKDWSAATTEAQQASLLTAAAAKQTAADWSLFISEIHRDAAGGQSVLATLRLPDGRLLPRQFPLRGNGELARATLVTQLLDYLRRQ